MATDTQITVTSFMGDRQISTRQAGKGAGRIKLTVDGVTDTYEFLTLNRIGACCLGSGDGCKSDLKSRS